MNMNKKNLLAIFIFATILLMSCDEKIKRDTSRVYMPDMMYSRAVETYADHSNLKAKGIFFNALPVKGTISIGAELPFELTKDAPGITTNYDLSKQIKSPIEKLDSSNFPEAERLYLINCGICHGTTLNGNGPLYKDGTGPFPAKPSQLVGDVKYEQMPEGQMFYSVTYGKNLMGSYSSQLSIKQRWMVIKYIKEKQAMQTKSIQPNKKEILSK